MDSVIRLLCVSNRATSANPSSCCDSIESLLSKQPPADITILPSLALCSPCCGNIFNQTALIEECNVALTRILKLSLQRKGYFLIGMPFSDGGHVIAVTAVLCDGKLLGLLPDNGDYKGLSKNFTSLILDNSTVFQCGNLRFCVNGGDYGTLLSRSMTAYKAGCDLFISPSFSPSKAGASKKFIQAAKAISQQYGIAIACVNGNGGSSSPNVFKGLACVFECGETMLIEDGEGGEFCRSTDIDWEIIRLQNKTSGNINPFYSCESINKKDLFRFISTNPFISNESQNKEEYLGELFSLQVDSLVARLENINCKYAVLGVSGGLDSTLALMVAAVAFDKLSLPRKNLICVTMPGFGTSDRTYFNALGLMEMLGVTMKDIPIRASVIQHFEDIDHDISQKDTTYENAQARERTQILFDIANQTNGIVVGTGDLSEAALGWCTFGGDALAGYNVNICIPKTIIRLLVDYLANNKSISGTDEFLRDILETPVSPELLPAHESGEIAQKTEDILGPYELHDFFIYYHVKYGFDTKKLYEYALCAFKDTYDAMEIKRCLAIFIKRFYSTQFKRNCTPDNAAITEINLSLIDWSIPSDMNFNYMQKQLEEI